MSLTIYNPNWSIDTSKFDVNSNFPTNQKKKNCHLITNISYKKNVLGQVVIRVQLMRFSDKKMFPDFYDK